MSTELEGVKELLRVYLGNMNEKLDKLTNSYENIRNSLQRIENDTNVAIAEIRKDVTALQARATGNAEEISAIKKRIEINEDVQLEKWTRQEQINEQARKKDDNIMKLQLGAIGTFITLAIAALWNRLTGGGAP